MVPAARRPKSLPGHTCGGLPARTLRGPRFQEARPGRRRRPSPPYRAGHRTGAASGRHGPPPPRLIVACVRSADSSAAVQVELLIPGSSARPNAPPPRRPGLRAGQLAPVAAAPAPVSRLFAINTGRDGHRMRAEPASSGCITRSLPLDSFQVDEEGGRGGQRRRTLAQGHRCWRASSRVRRGRYFSAKVRADFFTVLARTAWG